jgi:hypothetical protein
MKLAHAFSSVCVSVDFTTQAQTTQEESMVKKKVSPRAVASAWAIALATARGETEMRRSLHAG